ncbi:hypothetical protein A1O7_03489 [Cladophialophora yegresii CBS 114405]|uniref:Wings apart-like protein C-terminal domain-containing protein n=1 Tax=Cladophialophora yegresii CBS 114405 TaxID=1182544 RepID=W9WXQ0_9EURO|nr:uncharacterized protein A1O7_03489 [Cladophialophora yegresii CBS 114405]EXJ63044.1 hypothetical protein A1O7_03489 [Cladophialophora yegresii CBS 114405]
MMEFPVVRRKANTYGKGARKVRVHDLFDVGAQPLFESTKSTERHAPTPTAPSQDNYISQNSEEIHGRATLVDETRETKEDAIATRPSIPPSSDPSATFDIQSSEDDSGKLKSNRLSKKRKIVTVGPTGYDVFSSTTGDTKVAMHKVKGAQDLVKNGRPKTLQHESANVSGMAGRTKPDKSPPTAKRLGKAGIKSVVRRASASKTVSSVSVVVPKTFQRRELRTSSGSSADMSDASNHSGVSGRSTPKRQRVVSDGGVASPTPSDLHLTALRLTPGSGSQRSHSLSDDEEMRDVPVATASTGRARLIDRLDAPRTQSTRNLSTQVPGLQKEVSQPLKEPAIKTAPSKTLVRPALEKQTSSQSVAASGRIRATYAKQRSYLSDMVDSLDSDLPASTSQASSQQSHSQALSFTSGITPMEMDLEDSDDADTGSRIKSIHELRRGGAVRKFDLELQTILEDVESTTKSLRVTGLLQLADKLDEQMFLRHFQDSGNFQRLIDCVNDSLDEVSALFVALIFQSVVSAESSSPRVLLQVLDALYRLPPRFLSETRSVSRLAKDRSQNLSKLLANDIADFEKRWVKDLGQPSLDVDRIFLGAIESAQRKLISLKEPLPRLPRKLVTEVVSQFTKPQEDITAGATSRQIGATRLLLSFLEIACANNELAGSRFPTSRLHELGQAVASTMREVRHSHPEVEHSCLRLIVSLSNNEAEVCEALSKGNVVDAVFQVVDEHFLTLARLAVLEKEFDNSRLESVILAVGCLLNLAECADAARVKMLVRDSGGTSLVHRLIDIFNRHVNQATEALTMDQTQILVAFGYISALLCTLCLNRAARRRISKHIKGEGLSQLFGAADTFLQHLQTVEAALEDGEGSSVGFTARFTTVLETVKKQNV